MIDQLIQEALDYAAEQYGPQRIGEKVWNPHTYDYKLIELVVLECSNIDSKNWADPAYQIKQHFGIKT